MKFGGSTGLLVPGCRHQGGARKAHKKNGNTVARELPDWKDITPEELYPAIEQIRRTFELSYFKCS